MAVAKEKLRKGVKGYLLMITRKDFDVRAPQSRLYRDTLTFRRMLAEEFGIKAVNDEVARQRQQRRS